MADISFATPKVFMTGIPDQKPKQCRFCAHWAKQEGEDKGYCIAPDMPTYVEGGITSPISGDFGCEPFFEERQEL